MAGSIGNKNALGNNGGRPPYYDSSKPEDVEEVKRLCEDYFENIEGPPTVTGLTLYLNFDAKSTLYEYAKKIEFSNPIKRALTKIEQYHELMAAGGDKCTGNIFILKNFGWRDSVDHTTNGKDLPSTPTTITFKKYDGD